MTPRDFQGQLAARLGDMRVVAAFLTRVPMGEPDPKGVPISRSIWAFPVVGWGMGLGAGAVFAGCLGFGLDPLPAAVVAVAFEVWLAGAFHEDGLADTADGLGGDSPERRLEILRDSRIGTYGASALALFLMARIAVIAALSDPVTVALALAAAGAASRAALVWPMTLVPPARNDGMSIFIGVPTSRELALASVVAGALVLVSVGPGATLIVLAAAAIGAGAVSALARRIFGGQTGDLLGATQQVSYVLILLALAARL